MKAEFTEEYPVVAARRLDDLRSHRLFSRPEFTLMQAVHFKVDGIPHRILPGSSTDFASIPRLLLWLFPANGVWREAAAVHDGAYRGNVHRLHREWAPPTRKWADDVFLALMDDLRVGWHARYPLYWVLRMVGWRAWNQK